MINGLPVVGSIIAAWVSVLAMKHIKEVHLTINSRFDEWRELIKQSSFSAGAKSEVDKAAEIAKLAATAQENFDAGKASGK